MFLAGELVVDHVALGFLQPLDDDLLTVAGSDAAEFHIIYGQTDPLAHTDGAGDGFGIGAGNLAAWVFNLVHYGFLNVHFQRAMFLVHTHQNLFHIGVVVLVGVDQGLGNLIHHVVLGNTFFFFQHIQCGEDLLHLHAFAAFLFFNRSFHSK